MKKLVIFVFSFGVSFSLYGERVIKLRTKEDTVKVKREIIEERELIIEPEEGLYFDFEEEEKTTPIEKIKKVWKEYPRVTPSVLFSIPTGYVVDALAVYSVGGGTISPEMEEKKHQFFALVFGIGLGKWAELQANIVSVFSNVVKGSTAIPATCFKLRLTDESKKIPAISLLLKMSPVWHLHATEVIQDKTYKYSSRSAILYLISSKKIGDMAFHLGVNYPDYRIKSTPEGEEVSITFPYTIGGVVGFERKVREGTSVMLEYQTIPEIDFHKKELISIHTIVVGGRFFFLKIFSLDAGIACPIGAEFKGIADMILHTNITTSFYLQQLGRIFSSK